MDKTGGNPFFVNQFLRTLYEENLLHFILPTPEQKGHWQWDIAQIETLDITDNVVELMISKLKKLPQSVQQVLRLAACVGNHFDLDTLSVIYEKSVTDTFQDLMPVLTEELILPLSEFEMSSHDLHNSKFIIQHLRFLHDRVQQAAYALIDDEQKQAVHLQIGRLLFKNTSAKALEEKLFDILVHFNRSIKLLTHQVERLTVAQLNLMAGQKAKIATAYEAAIIYLTIGQECLTQNSWESKYDLTFNLYIEALETTYLNTHFEQIDTLSEIILQNTQSILDKAKVYEIKIQRYISQNQMQSALELGLATIKMLSISLSESPPQKVAIEKLYDLPKMTDPNKLMALRILRIIFPPAQITNPPLVLPIAFTMVQLCHDFGNSPLSAYAYILYGLVLCGPLGDIDSGYQFGKLALEMLKQFEAPEIKCEVICMFNFFVRHWKEAVNETVKPLPANIQLSLETGNIPYFSYTTMLYCQNLVLIGEPLFSVYQKQEAYIGLVQKFKQTYQLYNSSIWGQLVLNLSSKIQEQSQSLLIGELFDETNILPLLLQGENATTLFRFYLAKTILCYFLRNFTEAIANAVRAEEREKALKSTICVTQNSFYYSLALLAHYSMSTKNEQQEYLEKVETNQKKMQVWAFHAPMNFQHKYDLVEAEKARILGQHWSAAQLYEQAIVGAEKNQYLHEEALAYELAAEFYLACNMDKFAKTYLREAHYRYQQWGAIIKVADLQKRYPQFIDDTSSRQKTNYSTTITNSTLAQTTSQTNANWLDLNSVLKASQTLSGEMVLSRLLEKMMRIIIENAGAEKGFLLLLKQNNWFIEAEGCIDSDKVIVLQSLAIETSEQVPKPIIDYVARTLKKVVLPDATQVGNFTNISYIVKQRPKSLLCAPLLNRGQLTGILYLENNLITGAFTPERTELLNLLSSQIAISIENACLYTSITRFLPSEFLSLLNKKNIIDVQLGDQVEKEMSILFSDVRGFTALSEKMTPQENFDFINAYLSRMAPIIAQHNGFIDKYIGDAIMALFPGGANDAVNASIAMLKKLTAYNQKRHKLGLEPIAIGIGLNTGLLMLGTVGGENRMDGTVISDAVNLASRIEGMSKMYGAALLISEATYIHLSDASQYAIRTIDRVRVKGKLAPVTIYEVFDGDLPHLVDLKMKTLENFEEGLAYYRQQALTEAIPYFEDVLNLNPDDKVAQIYLNRCRHWQQIGVPDGWDGIEVLDSK
jgi:class 3 adenylate cyclase